MVDENHTVTISGDSIPEFSSCKNVCAQFLLHSVSRKCDSINGATNDLLSALIRTSHDSEGAASWQRTKIMLERANRDTAHCWKTHAPGQNVAATWKSVLYNECSRFKGSSGVHAVWLYVVSAYVNTLYSNCSGIGRFFGAILVENKFLSPRSLVRALWTRLVWEIITASTFHWNRFNQRGTAVHPCRQRSGFHF